MGFSLIEGPYLLSLSLCLHYYCVFVLFYIRLSSLAADAVSEGKNFTPRGSLLPSFLVS